MTISKMLQLSDPSSASGTAGATPTGDNAEPLVTRFSSAWQRRREYDLGHKRDSIRSSRKSSLVGPAGSSEALPVPDGASGRAGTSAHPNSIGGGHQLQPSESVTSRRTVAFDNAPLSLSYRSDAVPMGHAQSLNHRLNTALQEASHRRARVLNSQVEQSDRVTGPDTHRRSSMSDAPVARPAFRTPFSVEAQSQASSSVNVRQVDQDTAGDAADQAAPFARKVLVSIPRSLSDYVLVPSHSPSKSNGLDTSLARATDGIMPGAATQDVDAPAESAAVPPDDGWRFAYARVPGNSTPTLIRTRSAPRRSDGGVDEGWDYVGLNGEAALSEQGGNDDSSYGGPRSPLSMSSSFSLPRSSHSHSLSTTLSSRYISKDVYQFGPSLSSTWRGMTGAALLNNGGGVTRGRHNHTMHRHRHSWCAGPPVSLLLHSEQPGDHDPRVHPQGHRYSPYSESPSPTSPMSTVSGASFLSESSAWSTGRSGTLRGTAMLDHHHYRSRHHGHHLHRVHHHHSSSLHTRHRADTSPALNGSSNGSKAPDLHK